MSNDFPTEDDFDGSLDDPDGVMASEVLESDESGEEGADSTASVVEGLEDVDLSDIAADIAEVETVTQSSMLTSTKPHVLVETADILGKLSAIAPFFKNTDDPNSRLLFLVPGDDGVLSIYASFADFKFRLRTKLQNNQNVLSESIFVDFFNLLYVLKSSGRLFLLEKSGNEFVSKMSGGSEVPFDVYRGNATAYREIDALCQAGTKMVVDSTLFERFLTNASVALRLATRSEDKRILIRNGVGLANFLTSVVHFDNVGVSDLSVRGVFGLLKQLFPSGDTLGIIVGASHTVFESDRIAVVVPNIDCVDLQTSTQVKMPKDFIRAQVSTSKLRWASKLISNLSGNNSILDFFTEDGRLILKAPTVTGKAIVFPLVQVDGDVMVRIPATLMIKVLNVLSTSSTVDFNFSKEDKSDLRFWLSTESVKVFI